MKTLPVPPIDPKVDAEVRELLASGVPLPQMIRVMRDRGLNKIESMKLLRNHVGMTLGEAKEEVHCSETWNDRRISDEAFHETALEAAKQFNFEEQMEHEPANR